MPGLPVAQLALPALTITACMRPRDARRWSRPTVTGAATTWLRVNTAAAEAPSGIKAIARSGRPLALRPAEHTEKRKPCGSGRLTRPASPGESLSPGRDGRFWELRRGTWQSHHNTKG